MAEVILNFSGDDASLRQSVEQAIATYQMLMMGGSAVNFETWFEAWEAGFPAATLNRGVGNYDLTGEKPWRFDPTKRPRYREWTTPEQRTTLGYRNIEYWPDRSNENTSYALSGSDDDLIRHIHQIDYEGGGGTLAGKVKGGAWPYLKGQPLIRLYFQQEADKAPPGRAPIRGEIIFRIMDKSDDPKSPLPKISKADVMSYAMRIKEQFGTEPLYKWEKGKDIVAYRNRQQGFESWYAVKTKNDGIELITRLLAITQQTIDLTCVFHSQNADPTNAYPDNPPPIVVLGEEEQQALERPFADLYFQSAELELPKKRGGPVQLVYESEIVYSL